MKFFPKKNKKSDCDCSKSGVKKGFLIALICLASAAVLLVGVAAGAFFALKTAGRLSLSGKKDDHSSPGYVYDPDVLTYKGKRYRYNDDVISILFIGTDNEKAQKNYESIIHKSTLARLERGECETYEDALALTLQIFADAGVHPPAETAGHADSILILALNEKEKHMSIISVDRNSMSYFEAFDRDGNSIGESESQLALSYSYGDGGHESCKHTSSAVSGFLYDIPIHAYFSMKFEAVPVINDAVGGVEVIIPTDMTDVHEAFVKGAKVRLDGEMAARFIEARQTVGDGSNAGRMERQKQYIFSFIDTAVASVKKDWGLPARLYESISNSSYTDISLSEIVYLADVAASGLDFSFHSIPGTTTSSGYYDEFRPDKDALMSLVLDVFYTCEE